MQVLIIEDEPTAAEKLIGMLQEIDPRIEILDVIQNVDEAISWIALNPSPHLAFVDIQLADNISLDIFKQVKVNFPVIFTTAYDDFILEALEHNSIDYLLKPLHKQRLIKAMDKVKNLEAHFIQNNFNHLLGFSAPKTKKRFLVKKGIDFISISTRDIAYFFTAHKIVFLKDRRGNKYIIDKTLSDITNTLDPDCFFRANRKYLIHIDSIEKFKSDNGRIRISLLPPTRDEVTVSKENAPNFKKWIETF